MNLYDDSTINLGLCCPITKLHNEIFYSLKIQFHKIHEDIMKLGFPQNTDQVLWLWINKRGRDRGTIFKWHVMNN